MSSLKEGQLFQVRKTKSSKFFCRAELADAVEKWNLLADDSDELIVLCKRSTCRNLRFVNRYQGCFKAPHTRCKGVNYVKTITERSLLRRLRSFDHTVRKTAEIEKQISFTDTNLDENNKKENAFGLKDSKRDTISFNNIYTVEQPEPQDAKTKIVAFSFLPVFVFLFYYHTPSKTRNVNNRYLKAWNHTAVLKERASVSFDCLVLFALGLCFLFCIMKIRWKRLRRCYFKIIKRHFYRSAAQKAAHVPVVFKNRKEELGCVHHNTKHSQQEIVHIKNAFAALTRPNLTYRTAKKHLLSSEKKGMAFKLDPRALSRARLKKIEVNESNGAAQTTDISVYAEIYDKCDGDFDKIAEMLSSSGRDPVVWKDGIDSSSATDAEDFAKKILAGALLASDRKGGSQAGILTEGTSKVHSIIKIQYNTASININSIIIN